MAMSADVAGMLEQMREQQRQQAEQHNALLAMMAQQLASQIPVGPREQRPRDPAARAEERSELIPKFISCPQFNGKPENWEDFQFKFRRAVALSQQLLTRR